MRLGLALFFVGVVLVIAGKLLFSETHAQSKGGLMNSAAGRAPAQIHDLNATGLKVEVPDTAQMIKALEEKQEELRKKELELAALQERIKTEEDELRKQIEKYQKMQNEIHSLYEKNKAREDEIFKKLLGAVQKMEPKKASAVIALMEDNMAIEILLGLKDNTVAQILNAMEPSRATTLSSKIASRRPARQLGENDRASQ